MRAVHVLACLGITIAKAEQRYDPQEFIASQPQNTSLWSLQCSLKVDKESLRPTAE